jgi:hypothetical protein
VLQRVLQQVYDTLAAPRPASESAATPELPLVHGLMLTLRYVLEEVDQRRIMASSAKAGWREVVQRLVDDTIRGYRAAMLIVAENDTVARVPKSEADAAPKVLAVPLSCVLSTGCLVTTCYGCCCRCRLEWIAAVISYTTTCCRLRALGTTTATPRIRCS